MAGKLNMLQLLLLLLLLLLLRASVPLVSYARQTTTT
jgi:hypothetical protein